MQKIVTFLWFDDQAEEAMNFYVSIFRNSKIGQVSRYGEGSRGEPGKVMTASFELDGQPFTALNGGPHFKFNEAVSFYVDCDDQAEVDRLWDALISGGGSPSQCGWLKDRYGVSWQIVPAALSRLLSDPDKGRAERAMAAMLKMTRIDVAALEAAAAGPP